MAERDGSDATRVAGVSRNPIIPSIEDDGIGADPRLSSSVSH